MHDFGDYFGDGVRTSVCAQVAGKYSGLVVVANSSTMTTGWTSSAKGSSNLATVRYTVD